MSAEFRVIYLALDDYKFLRMGQKENGLDQAIDIENNAAVNQGIDAFYLFFNN
jgi:hypothetical protein